MTAPACPVCLDTGIVQTPDPDRESVYESACPERVHDDARDIGARRAAELFTASADENWLGI